MRRIVTFCTLWFGLAGVPDAAGPVTVLPDDGLLVELQDLAPSAAARQSADRWLAALEAGDAAAAIADGRAERDPLRFEQAATRAIDALRRAAPSAAGRRWLQWLATQPPRVWRQHEETAADVFVPVFALDQRAAGTLELWRHVDARNAWLARFDSDMADALTDLQQADPAALAAAADAIGRLDDDTLGRLSARLARQAAPIALSVAVAARRADAATLQRIVRLGTQAQQFAALARLDALGGEQALELIELASSHPALASAATLALADLVPRHPPALQRLQERLDDPRLGSSAAAALTRLPSERRVSVIEGMLTAKSSATAAANLVLALRLDGSPEAHAVLQRWRDDPQLSELLRQGIDR